MLASRERCYAARDLMGGTALRVPFGKLLWYALPRWRPFGSPHRNPGRPSMTPRKQKNLRQRPAKPLRPINPHAAGIDVHAAVHWVAMHGNWREEHLSALKQAMTLYEFYQQPVRECDAPLQRQWEAFADRREGKPLSHRSRPLRKRANHPAFDVHGALYRMAGVDLTVLEGIDEGTALVIRSEVGADVSRFATVKLFTSWLGRGQYTL
jgi:hypothetical protein